MSWQHAGNHEINVNTLSQLHELMHNAEYSERLGFRGTSRRFWALKFAIFSLNENVQNIENNEKSPKSSTGTSISVTSLIPR